MKASAIRATLFNAIWCSIVESKRHESKRHERSGLSLQAQQGMKEEHSPRHERGNGIMLHERGALSRELA